MKMFIPEGDSLRKALALDPTETRGIERHRLRSQSEDLSGREEGQKRRVNEEVNGGANERTNRGVIADMTSDL